MHVSTLSIENTLMAHAKTNSLCFICKYVPLYLCVYRAWMRNGTLQNQCTSETKYWHFNFGYKTKYVILFDVMSHCVMCVCMWLVAGNFDAEINWIKNCADKLNVIRSGFEWPSWNWQYKYIYYSWRRDWEWVCAMIVRIRKWRRRLCCTFSSNWMLNQNQTMLNANRRW